MPKRVQSPSSINTFKQCPRKYFYQYIIKYPTKENIHCVRGNIVHEALEKFFDIDAAKLESETYKKELSCHLKDHFDSAWKKAASRLQKVGLPDDKISFYYTESTQMLANWLNQFFTDMEKGVSEGMDITQAFTKIAPSEIEKQYKDPELMVRGFIDVVHKDGDTVTLIDYKTSKTDDWKPEYTLQLGIYAVLYEKTHGCYPQKVGLWLLKHGYKEMGVTPKMVKDALFEIEQIHFATESDTITDYRKKESGLCKWATGQCDFYDICRRER
ncbi:MAG: PD-(D/E)XK nuclease family protein [Candidatus Woesearchaeota archaeon]